NMAVPTAVVAAQAAGQSTAACPVISTPRITEAKSAREPPAKNATMPASAASWGDTAEDGSHENAAATTTPIPPPATSIGASVPPDVPLPREITHAASFSPQSKATTE